MKKYDLLLDAYVRVYVIVINNDISINPTRVRFVTI